MKLFLLLTILSCWSVQSILGGRFVCYFPSWATYREDAGKYGIENIDQRYCTHLVYSFAVLDSETLTIAPGDPDLDINKKGYDRFTALKRNDLKTMIAIGGWTDSTDGDDKYTRLVTSQQNIDRFVQSVIQLLQRHNFDGLDVDWEYPKTTAEKNGYVNLLKALRQAFGSRYLLSGAIPVATSTLNDGFDIAAINAQVDYLNLMAYDIHGDWEKEANHHAPLYQRSGDGENYIDFSVSYLLSRGLEANKLNLGIPIYGKSWTLSPGTSPNCVSNCPASGAGAPGEFTNEEGMLAYSEICTSIIKNGWTNVQDPSLKAGPYAYSNQPDAQWVGYDDVAMVKTKSDYVNSKRLGGAMIWDMSMDDFLGNCRGGINPLLRTIHETVVQAGRD